MRKRKKLGIISIALIIILILLFTFRDVIAYNLFPKQYIMLSISKTFNEVNKDFQNIQTMFFGDILKKSNTKDLNITIDNAKSSDPFDYLKFKVYNGLDFYFKTTTDIDNKFFYLEGKTSRKEKLLLSLNLKLDDNELLIKIPELYDKTFMLPSKNLGKEWNQSTFGENSSREVDENLDISFSAFRKSFEVVEMDKQTKNNYLNALKTLTKNGDYKKSGKQEVLIGETLKKHRRTIVTLDPNNAKNGLIELIEAFENDNRLEEGKENLIFTNQKQSVKALEKKLKDLKQTIKEDYHKNKTTLDLLTRKGKAIEINLETTSDVDKIHEALKLSLGFLGEKSITDDFIFELTEGQNKDKIVLTSKNILSDNTNEISNHIEFTLYNNGYETKRLNSWAEIDPSKEKDNLTYNLNILSDNNMNIDIKAKGDFKSSTKNIEYNLHNISFIMEDSYSDKKITFEGSLFLSSREGAETIPITDESEKVKILEILEHDIFKILERLEKIIK